jgi:hypothetical protein
MSVVLRQLVYLAGYGTLGIVLTLAVAFGIDLANRRRLMSWHLAPLSAEFRAADAPKVGSLDDYRAF